MCALVRVRSKEDPFVSDARIEAAVFREVDAKPGNELPVWRRHPQTNEITSAKLRWGLIPHWMKARPEIQPINARAETVAEKRMFADAYAKRRCIVPMDVFYERDKRKKLHAFAMTDGTPFGVAGIWENWRNQNGEWERTFCIITVRPTNWSERSTTACRPSFRSSSTRAGLAPNWTRAICCSHFRPHS